MFKKLEKVILDSRYYNQIRFNPLMNALVEILQHKTAGNIAFYRSFLETNVEIKTIFDVGANKGNKVNAFLKMGFRVYAFEPEHHSIETLEYRFARNPRVTIIKKGLSNEPGTLKMFITHSRSGLNTLSDEWMHSLKNADENRWQKGHTYRNAYEVEVTTLDHCIQQFGLPYFIKIDVEGFELNVIRGLSQMPPFISFETNLPEFADHTIKIVEHLYQLDPTIEFNYSIEDRLELNKWYSYVEMIAFLKGTSNRYMEIICRKSGK